MGSENHGVPVEDPFEFASPYPGSQTLYQVKPEDTCVDVYGGLIRRILPSIGLLTKLTEIHIENNVLVEVSEEIGNLCQLTVVSFHRNKLRTLPESFGNLVELRELNLSHNKITRLPKSFGRLKRLKSLDLNNNQMFRLPDSFGNLEKLSELKLAQNRLSGIPDSLKKCTELRLLILSANHLRGELIFPQEWKKMSYLSLRSCTLCRLSESIDWLESLEILDLGRNCLVTLPSMKRLRNLLQLNLAENPLKEIPPGLRHLSRLRTLTITDCKITRLPEWLGELRSLTSLDADMNNISEFPECMGELKQLRCLTIWRNYITEIPKCVGMLPELTSFFVDPVRVFPPALLLKNATLQLCVLDHWSYNHKPSKCSMCPEHFPPSKEIQSLMVLAARRLIHTGTDGIVPEELPRPCLELIQSARECSTPGCSGIFVKGSDREAVKYRRLGCGNRFPFYYATCHPLCDVDFPMNWPRERKNWKAANPKPRMINPPIRGSNANIKKWCALGSCILSFLKLVFVSAFQGWALPQQF